MACSANLQSIFFKCRQKALALFAKRGYLFKVILTEITLFIHLEDFKMTFSFVEKAYAMGTPGAAPQGGGMESMLIQFAPLILMFVVFYFLLIRPQQKKAKEHKTMLSALKKGDHVLTNAGILGRIAEIEGDVFTLDLGKTEIKILRGYITTVVDPKNLTNAPSAPQQ